MTSILNIGNEDYKNTVVFSIRIKDNVRLLFNKCLWRLG